MKKLIYIFCSVLITFIILLIAGGHYFYNESVKRGQKVELHRESETVTAFANKENKIIAEATAWFEQQSLQTITLESYDGLTLKAKLLESNNKSGHAVILAHGYRNDYLSMKNLVKFYHDEGFSVLMPDTRGHGESEGDYIGYGWHDRLDYQKWIQFLIEKKQSKSIFLHGNSMGAALVLMTSGEELPNEVKGIIADSAYTSVMDELTYQLKHLYKLPSFPIMQVTSAITKVKAGYTFEEASVVNQVSKNTRPLFIIHGDADELVPKDMAHEIYETAKSEKELWMVPKAGHTKAYSVATEEFQYRLKNFIAKCLN